MTKIAPYTIGVGYRCKTTGDKMLAHPTVVCSWCKDVVRDGYLENLDTGESLPLPEGGVVRDSHGMCIPCAKLWRNTAAFKSAHLGLDPKPAA